MSDMVGKMSVQEKIAELESRIAALESRITALEKGRTVRTTVVEETTETNTTTIRGKAPFGEHWDKMWDEFNLMFKDVFK